MSEQAHWEEVYRERQPQQVSWYEPAPDTSLALIKQAGLSGEAPIIDVGAGTSALAGRLLEAGYSDVTVADISAVALARAKAALGDAASRVTWICADVRTHGFAGRYQLWHDRAVFHFMVQPEDRDRYLAVLRRTLDPAGHLILATFGPDGPTQCSGLAVTRYSEQALLALMGTEFTLLSARLVEHRTPSGASQQFLYTHWRREPTGDPDTQRELILPPGRVPHESAARRAMWLRECS